jgi:hypothetical protein
VAQINRGRVSDPAQAALSGSHNEAPGSAGGNLTTDKFHEHIDYLESLMAEREEHDKNLAITRQSLDAVNVELAKNRKADSETVTLFSRLFDAIIRDLFPENILDEASFVTDKLKLKVKNGGKTLPEGFEAVKVLAFDLRHLHCR